MKLNFWTSGMYEAHQETGSGKGAGVVGGGILGKAEGARSCTAGAYILEPAQNEGTGLEACIVCPAQWYV